MAASTDAIPLRIQTDGHGRHWISGHSAWPRSIMIAEDCRVALPECIRLRWPYMGLRFENGMAVYEVGTLEAGMWRGSYLEGWLHPC